MEGQRFPKSLSSLEDIHQQIASLRRENRFLKFGLVFCLVIATLPYLAGFQPATIRAKRLVTEKVEFVRDGLTVWSIDIHPITYRLVISGTWKKPLVVLDETMGGGKVSVCDKDGKAGVIMDATPLGGSISVRDKDGKAGVIMNATPLGGSISVSDNDGKSITTMSAGLFGSSVSLHNRDGKFVAGISATEKGGMIFLADGKGIPIWSAP